MEKRKLTERDIDTLKSISLNLTHHKEIQESLAQANITVNRTHNARLTQTIMKLLKNA